MPLKSETRAVEARESRNGCAGPFRYFHTSQAMQVQFLIAAHHVRPELAAMIAALAFGGAGHG